MSCSFLKSACLMRAGRRHRRPKEAAAAQLRPPERRQSNIDSGKKYIECITSTIISLCRECIFESYTLICASCSADAVNFESSPRFALSTLFVAQNTCIPHETADVHMSRGKFEDVIMISYSCTSLAHTRLGHASDVVRQGVLKGKKEKEPQGPVQWEVSPRLEFDCYIPYKYIILHERPAMHLYKSVRQMLVHEITSSSLPQADMQA